MAWSSKDARDIPPVHNLVCHRNRSCGIVICILCDSPWCKSDFNKTVVSEGKGFYVSKNLMVCPAHSENITYSSIETLHVDGNTVIENLEKKLCLINTYKNSIEKGETPSIDVEVNDEVSSVISDNDSVTSGRKRARMEDGVLSDCESCSLYCIENESLKKLNAELTRHNNELRENNTFLRSHVADKDVFSYARVAGNFPKKRIDNSAPAIILKNQNADGIEPLLKKTMNILTTKSKIQIENVFKTKDKVIVKCFKSADVAETEKLLQSLKSNDTSIMQEKKSDPKIKIVDVDQETATLPNEDIVQDIQLRNSFLFDRYQAKIDHKYQNNKTGKWTLLITVNALTYENIMQRNKLFIGSSHCRVFDDYNITMCFKCSKHGHHSQKKCNSTTFICGICAESHSTKECSNKNSIKCCNCIAYNRKFNKNRDFNHKADEKNKCETYLEILKNNIRKIDYPFNPLNG